MLEPSWPTWLSPWQWHCTLHTPTGEGLGRAGQGCRCCCDSTHTLPSCRGDCGCVGQGATSCRAEGQGEGWKGVICRVDSGGVCAEGGWEGTRTVLGWSARPGDVEEGGMGRNLVGLPPSTRRVGVGGPVHWWCASHIRSIDGVLWRVPSLIALCCPCCRGNNKDFASMGRAIQNVFLLAFGWVQAASANWPNRTALQLSLPVQPAP